jgi:alkanesulfonate monooxygenase SsuD/methylene tetrahydromethanopterin reductase-like flavin-dependent oxidoreductase (luciferase family)
MTFGVCLPSYGNGLSNKALVESAQVAEALGFDSVWATNHILIPNKHAHPYGNNLDCLTTLTYVGAVTEKIQPGTSVLVLPLRNP